MSTVLATINSSFKSADEIENVLLQAITDFPVSRTFTVQYEYEYSYIIFVTVRVRVQDLGEQKRTKYKINVQ